jgi:hypothetical protein
MIYARSKKSFLFLGFQTKMYAILISLIRATCLTLLTLPDFITLIVLGVKKKYDFTTVCKFITSPVTSVL